MFWVCAILFFALMFGLVEWQVDVQHPKLKPEHRRIMVRYARLALAVLAIAVVAGRIWPDLASAAFYTAAAIGFVLGVIALRRISWI